MGLAGDDVTGLGFRVKVSSNFGSEKKLNPTADKVRERRRQRTRVTPPCSLHSPKIAMQLSVPLHKADMKRSIELYEETEHTHTQPIKVLQAPSLMTTGPVLPGGGLRNGFIRA